MRTATTKTLAKPAAAPSGGQFQTGPVSIDRKTLGRMAKAEVKDGYRYTGAGDYVVRLEVLKFGTNRSEELFAAVEYTVMEAFPNAKGMGPVDRPGHRCTFMTIDKPPINGTHYFSNDIATFLAAACTADELEQLEAAREAAESDDGAAYNTILNQFFGPASPLAGRTLLLSGVANAKGTFTKKYWNSPESTTADST